MTKSLTFITYDDIIKIAFWALFTSLIRNQVRDLNERVAVNGVDAGKDGVAANIASIEPRFEKDFSCLP